MGTNFGPDGWVIPHRNEDGREFLPRLIELGFKTAYIDNILVDVTPPAGWHPLQPERLEQKKWLQAALSILADNRRVWLMAICDAEGTPIFFTCEENPSTDRTAWLIFID
jgi:hypothetical protein